MDALTRVGLRRPDGPPAQRAVRRPAAARGHRPRPGQPAQHPPGRRADRQPRLARRARKSWRCSSGLHRDGQTIILVTHEHDIAAHARRQVHLKDGRVERDRREREPRKRVAECADPCAMPRFARLLAALGRGPARRTHPVGLPGAAGGAPVDIIVYAQAAGAIQPDTTVEVKSKASGEILQIKVETGQTRQARRAAGAGRPAARRGTPGPGAGEPRGGQGAARQRRDARSAAPTSCSRRSRSPSRSTRRRSSRYANAKARGRERPGGGGQREDPAGGHRRPGADHRHDHREERASAGRSSRRPRSDVGGGTVLLKMADLNLVQVRTLVDETDIGKIEPGPAPRSPWTRIPNRAFEGTVLKIEPQAETAAERHHVPGAGPDREPRTACSGRA